MVVGGGNSAVEEALFLSQLASSVTVVHRRDQFRAERILVERLAARPNVTFKWNRTVEEILGGGTPRGVMGVRLRDTRNGEIEDIQTDGVFVAIGHAPATELFKGKLELDAAGYIVVEPGTPKTAIPGVFACGDVMDHTYRQAVTAAGTGCMAALDAERFLATRAFAAARQAAE